jgi:hypothetical protein
MLVGIQQKFNTFRNILDLSGKLNEYMNDKNGEDPDPGVKNSLPRK